MSDLRGMAEDTGADGVDAVHSSPSARGGLPRGMMVLLDQGLYSITSLAAGMLVARDSSKEEFGYYTLAMTFLMTLINIQRCVISVPYTVLGSRMPDDVRREYLGSTMIHSLSLSLLCTVGLVAAGIVVSRRGPGSVPSLLFALAVACAALLSRDFVRSTLLARLRVGTSLVMGAACSLGTLGMLAAVFFAGRLTGAMACWATALGSALPTLVVWFSLRNEARLAAFRILRDLASAWRFGRWTLAATGANALAMQAIPWFLLLFKGPGDVALFGALSSVAGLIRPAVLGVSSYVTPRLALEYAAAGVRGTFRRGIAVVRAVAGGAVLYVVLMSLFGDPIVRILFTSAYAGHRLLLAVASLAVGIEAADTMLKAVVRAVDYPESETWSQLFAGGVTAALCIGFIPFFGLEGAVGILAAHNGIYGIVIWRMLRRFVARTSRPGESR